MRWTAKARAFAVVVTALIFTSFGIIGSLTDAGENGTAEGTDGVSFGLVVAEEALRLLAANADDPGFVLLDIRTPAEVAAAHIPGATQLDFRDAAFFDALQRLGRDNTYLIYCRTANRTGQAWQLMHDLGFDRVYDLEGGITRWIELGYPVCAGELGDDHACPVGAYAELTNGNTAPEDPETERQT